MDTDNEKRAGAKPMTGRKGRRRWLTDGVSKKGDRVLAWSIGMPNNRCPFASDICQRYCYADSGQFTFHFERYAENFEFTTTPEFVETMTNEIVRFAEIHSDEAVSVALHEKGEIYSLDYLGKWEEVVSATSDLTNVSYFIYTRAWRSEPFRTALEELSRNHKNVRVNLSTDSDMVAKFGVPARIGDGMVTWLAETDEDIPPAGVDLAFRNLRMRHNDSMERLGDALVCPYESKLYISQNKEGTPSLEKGKCRPIRCQECRLCIDRSMDEWEAIKPRYAGTPGEEPARESATFTAGETERPVVTGDPPPPRPSVPEGTPHPMSDTERHWHDRIERVITRYQSAVIETCLDAADHGMAISPFTRDRLTNTAVVIYQFANTILPPREEP